MDTFLKRKRRNTDIEEFGLEFGHRRPCTIGVADNAQRGSFSLRANDTRIVRMEQWKTYYRTSTSFDQDVSLCHGHSLEFCFQCSKPCSVGRYQPKHLENQSFKQPLSDTSRNFARPALRRIFMLYQHGMGTPAQSIHTRSSTERYTRCLSLETT